LLSRTGHIRQFKYNIFFSQASFPEWLRSIATKTYPSTLYSLLTIIVFINNQPLIRKLGRNEENLTNNITKIFENCSECLPNKLYHWNPIYTCTWRTCVRFIFTVDEAFILHIHMLSCVCFEKDVSCIYLTKNQLNDIYSLWATISLLNETSYTHLSLVSFCPT
jgi:hypothetical protein